MVVNEQLGYGSCTKYVSRLVQAAIVLGAFGLAHLLGQRRLVGTS